MVPSAQCSCGNASVRWQFPDRVECETKHKRVRYADPLKQSAPCLESEVRFILRLARKRTLDLKDTSKPMLLVWFGSEIRLTSSPHNEADFRTTTLA